MVKVTKRIKSSINIILALVFIIHISSIIHGILNPDLPDIRKYKKDLKDIEFPVAFQLCVDELVNSTKRYNDVGYNDAYTLFYGISLFNSSINGWAGRILILSLRKFNHPFCTTYNALDYP